MKKTMLYVIVSIGAIIILYLLFLVFTGRSGFFNKAPSYSPPQNYCGDGECDLGKEDTCNCPQDCERTVIVSGHCPSERPYYDQNKNCCMGFESA